MKRTRRIAALGMLIALEILLSRFLSVSTPFMKISFGFVPSAMAGMLWGPASGALVGGVSDFIGALLWPTGSFHPGFTLTYALAGAVYGSSLCRPRVSGRRALCTAFFVNLFVYFLLDSVWLFTILGAGVFAQLGTRLVKNLVMIPINAAVLRQLCRWRDRIAAPYLAADKAASRAEAKRFWAQFTGQQRCAVSEQIAKRALSLSQLADRQRILCYVGVAGELDTEPLLRELLAAGKQLYLPRCEADGSMTARLAANLDDLTPDRIGIPAPPESAPCASASELDAVLLPGLAFDRVGTRLGKGKACYDRFLAGSAPLLVGLCPQGALQRRLPFDSRDVPAQLLVTEKRCIRCR